MKNPYDELGVKKNSTLDEIKRAFRKKSKKTHPDTGGTNEKFDDTKKAYMVLCNPKKRKQFDETGTIGPDEPQQHIHNEISAVFFGIIKQHEKELQYLDIIKVMIAIFNKAISGATHANTELCVKIIRNKELATRFSRKDNSEDNIFLNFINAEISNLEMGIISNTETIERLTLAISIVEIYKCEFKIKEESKNVFNSQMINKQIRNNNNPFRGSSYY